MYLSYRRKDSSRESVLTMKSERVRAAISAVVAAVSLLGPLGNEAWAQAAAWTRASGEMQVIAQGSWVRAAELYGFDGQVQDYESTRPGETVFQDTSLYFNVEIGVLSWLTLSADVPYKILEVEDASFVSRTEALGDLTLGARIGIFELLEWSEAPFALAVEPRIRFASGYTRNLRPSAGPGQIDFELHVAAGVALPIPVVSGYAQARVGYRLRSGTFAFSNAQSCQDQGTPGANCFEEVETPGFGDEFLWGLELGITPFSGKVVAFGKVSGNFSVDAPDVGFDPANPIPDRQRFIKVGGGGILYPIQFFTDGLEVVSNLGLLFQYFTTPDGRNTIRSDDLFAGLIYSVAIF